MAVLDAKAVWLRSTGVDEAVILFSYKLVELFNKDEYWY